MTEKADIDFSFISNLCKQISEADQDIGIAFHRNGEAKPWEDLRICHFSLLHTDWEEWMGEIPTFGCYSNSSLEDALLDVRRGRIAEWVREVDCAVKLLTLKGDDIEGIRKISEGFSNEVIQTAYDAAAVCASYSRGSLRLAEHAWNSGEFFTFTLEPGSIYSTQIGAIFIESEQVGIYKKWKSSGPELVTLQARNRKEVIAHARVCYEVSSRDKPESDINEAILKKCWGY